ncbi:MAG: glycosyltransferase family 1 protein [Pseudomonadota bacterium]
MIRICIDCRYIGSRPSGIGEMVQALVRFAPGLAPDCEFTFLRNAEIAGKLSAAENVTELRIKSAANGPRSMWLLPRLVDLSKINVFHAPSNILPAGLKSRTVTTIHDIMWLSHPHWCNARMYGKIERQFYAHGIRRALKHSSHITTVSEATRQAIIERAPELSPKVTAVLSGVSTRFHPIAVDRQALCALGIREGRRFVLVVGQYAPYKNHEQAIAAFAKAFGQRSGIDLVMVQRQGHGVEKLVRLAEDLGIARRILFTGPVSEATLVQLYSGASALLHPSLCEGFGNPLAEAMACGCPVITSNRSAMPEVTNGAAQLVSPDQVDDISAALEQVVDDRELAEQMRRAGKARAEQLSWKDFAQRHVDIYREVAEGA